MSAMPPPGQGQPGGGAPSGSSPSQAPASPEMMMIAQITQALKRMAQSNPVLAPGLGEAVQGLQKAQSALVMGASGQSTPPSQNPPV